MAATSLPPPGSVTAIAVTASPRQMAGRYFSLSASLPVQYRCGEAMSQCTPTAMAKEPERDRAHSSCSTAEVSTSAPAPPYLSSYSTPSRPSSPMRDQIQRGIRPAASHSSTCGAISLSTKLRTVLRNISCCSLKIFTAEPRGASRRAPPTGLDRFAVHRAVRRARERIGERHHVRALEARDPRANEVAHLLGGVATPRRDFHYGLDRLAPAGVGNADHAGAGDAFHLHDDRLHLGRVHVLTARLDELRLRLAADIVEIAL